MRKLTNGTRLVICISIALAPFAFAQTENTREWSDATGTHKIVASLVEVQGNDVYLKTSNGKTMKIPKDKLSPSDQEFLDNSESPFEVVSENPSPFMAVNEAPPEVKKATLGTSQYNWNSPYTVDWKRINELVLDPGSGWDGKKSWGVPLPKVEGLGYTASRAILPKKANFHEHMHPLAINAVAQRAAVGSTVSFSVPSPLSRLSLVDLSSGSEIHSDQIECHMRPLAVLGDGSTVLMVGASDERGGHETPDQVQLWKISGRNVFRSPIWKPFPDDAEAWGKKTNGEILKAVAIDKSHVVLCSKNGHLAMFDIASRTPIWHMQLDRNFSVAESVDASLLAVFNGSMVHVIDTKTNKIVATKTFEDKSGISWPRIEWCPTSKRILCVFAHRFAILNLESGEWEMDEQFPGGLMTTGKVGFPSPDFLLIDNRLLFHIPSKLQVCEYTNAAAIEVVGGISFIGMMADTGGLLVPSEIPHPKAKEVLANSQLDPSMFLLHPGVEISINTSAVPGQHKSAVETGLKDAITKAGFKYSTKAEIEIVAAITGPTQEAVSYIARGAYVVNTFKSSIKVVWKGKEVWGTSGSNVPGFLTTNRNETIEDRLREVGKSPNLNIFSAVNFPPFMQRPADNQSNQARSNAMLASKFTMQGLVDSE